MMITIITCLAALALGGISLLLIRLDFARHSAGAPENNRAALSGRAWVFAGVMIALCAGMAAALSLVYPENSFLFNMKRLCLLSLLWPAALVDYKTLRIPNLFIIAGCAYRVIIFAFELLLEGEGLLPRAAGELIAAAAIAVAALLCALLVKNSIGFGDVKLFIVMGLHLGLEGIWSAVFVSLFVSFIVSVVLLATKKKTRRDVIPFAPAIMLGTFLSVFLTGR
ncbi:MAG: A24 family peptidase [Oscillospiraceae bacterium]|jgi:leader peptidase (prepilin peptidase)/N-methyltransferase|nr:A24 family peptidase [Oscillospiraceae bacterium]